MRKGAKEQTEGKYQILPLSLIQPNDGQIEGLPANPRQINEQKYELLKKNITDYPELLEYRGLLVYPHDGKYITIGGNMRLRALSELNYKEAPCAVLPAETTVEQLKAYIILDNDNFGQWDWDMLANEWDVQELDDWGINILPSDWGGGITEENEDYNSSEETESSSFDKNPQVEEMLKEAMRDNIKETLQQLELLKPKGWVITGLTKGLCEAKFIRAKYYGETYPQYLALYFQPSMISTAANKISIIEQMKKITHGGDDGIAGFRTCSADGNITATVFKSGYPIGGARMPLDFPSLIAKNIYNEFSQNDSRPDVLDPCHGWGGRLIGALLADVNSYTGIDPSPMAHEGVEKIIDAFSKYSPNTSVQLIKAPFEKVSLEAENYDIALTSPPYFDVEKYGGEEQSHVLYPKYEILKENFYRPLIENTYRALRRGGVFVLQVGSQTYPLAEDCNIIAKGCGFSVDEVRPFGGNTSNPLHGYTDEDEKNEKLIILKKK